jgi:hypothetical protein
MYDIYLGVCVRTFGANLFVRAFRLCVAKLETFGAFDRRWSWWMGRLAITIAAEVLNPVEKEGVRGFLLDGYQSNNGCQGICLLRYYSPCTRQDISLFVQPTIQMFPCFPLNSIQLVKSWMAARMRRRGNEMQNVEQRCDKVKR